MRIFCAGIVTETNTYSPMPTAMDDFAPVRARDLTPEKPTLGGSGQVVDLLRRRTEELGGEFIFSLYGSAQPAGTTVRSVYESLRDEVLADLRAALPVDIVILPLHGAMVADGYDDCEGDIIARAREVAGPETVIGVELDLHAHVTELMVDEADIIVLYKEYPHVDILARADDLFRLCVQAARGEIKPTMGLFDCRMMGVFRTPVEPMRSFVDGLLAREGKDGVLSLSLSHGFPWADVPACGVRMVAVTDNDPAQAQQVAEEIGRAFFNMRHEVSGGHTSLTDAVDYALAQEKRPIVLADVSDNAGGGAPSDSTFLLRALLEKGATDVAVGMFWDPVLVQLVKRAGPGARMQVRLGGKIGPASGDPLDLAVEVVGVIEEMIQEWPQQGQPPLRMFCGDSVMLRMEGNIHIVVNTKRSQVFSPQVFSNFGIDPTQKRILAIKSTQHFYAAFAPIAAEVLYVSAPGAIPPEMTIIPFTRVDLNKYPWVEDPFATS